MTEHAVTLNNNGGLCEIYQSVGIKFAFCEVEKKPKTSKMGISQLHPWIKCRDFLGDALFATYNKCSYDIYGFNFDGTAKMVPTNLTYLLVQHTNKEDLERNLKVLHHFEKKVKWKKTKLIDLNTKAGTNPVFLLVSSKRWVSSTVLISLYTMLWRLAGAEGEKHLGIKEDETVDAFVDRCSSMAGNDGNYLKQIKGVKDTLGMSEHPFYTVMRHNRAIFKDSYVYQKRDIPGRVHNNNGILTIVNMAKQLYDSTSAPTGQYADQTARNLAKFMKKKVKTKCLSQ